MNRGMTGYSLKTRGYQPVNQAKMRHGALHNFVDVFVAMHLNATGAAPNGPPHRT